LLPEKGSAIATQNFSDDRWRQTHPAINKQARFAFALNDGAVDFDVAEGLAELMHHRPGFLTVRAQQFATRLFSRSARRFAESVQLEPAKPASQR
jgi:hypothetical protein